MAHSNNKIKLQTIITPKTHIYISVYIYIYQCLCSPYSEFICYTKSNRVIWPLPVSNPFHKNTHFRPVRLNGLDGATSYLRCTCSCVTCPQACAMTFTTFQRSLGGMLPRSELLTRVENRHLSGHCSGLRENRGSMRVLQG